MQTPKTPHQALCLQRLSQRDKAANAPKEGSSLSHHICSVLHVESKESLLPPGTHEDALQKNSGMQALNPRHHVILLVLLSMADGLCVIMAPQRRFAEIIYCHSFACRC